MEYDDRLANEPVTSSNPVGPGGDKWARTKFSEPKPSTAGGGVCRYNRDRLTEVAPLILQIATEISRNAQVDATECGSKG